METNIGGGRGCPRKPARATSRARRALLALVALAVLAAAGAGLAVATPAAGAIELSSPQLTLKSTYTGTLEAHAHAERAPAETEDIEVKEKFKVEAEQRVDNQGDTVVFTPTVKIEEGTETGTIPLGEGKTETVSCTLSPGTGFGPHQFTPAGAEEHAGLEVEYEGRQAVAFIAKPATDYQSFDVRSFLPTDSLGEPANELTFTKGEGGGEQSCKYAEKAGGFVKQLTCTVEAEGTEGEPFLPHLEKLALETPPATTPQKLKGKCESGAIAGAEEKVTVDAGLALEVTNAKAVFEAKTKEEEEKLAEEEALKHKEEERKRKEEEAAHKVEVPKPPVIPPEEPKPAETPAEALVAAEGRLPKQLTPKQLRRIARRRTSPSDRARNRALRSALAATTKVRAAKCTVALAVDGALDGVRFVNPIPGETTAGGAVTDLSTRRCLNLLAQTRAALVVARHDPPSRRYPAIRLPARAAAAASLPCTPSALGAAAYAACSGLIRADRESDRHLERIALVATAVAGTINRHSGAMLAGRQADAEFQDVAYNALVAELGQSLQRAQEANVALAGAFAAAGSDITFGGALAAHTPRHLERATRAATGARRSALRTLLGAAQLAVPTLPGSYRSALSAQLPVGALADGGTFRPRELILLIRQLVKQSQIPSALGGAMVSELSALKKAKGDAATALRRQLAASIRQLKTEAGPLLEAATRIRSPRL